jgi:antitoxin (DNA-binding transcriptional repressor) of toxin-antitoxin stability system
MAAGRDLAASLTATITGAVPHLTGTIVLRNIRNMSGKRTKDRGAGRRSVSATDAAKNFGRLVDRVRETRATYVVERAGVPVAQVGPAERAVFTMADFKALVAEKPRAGDDYVTAVSRAVERHSHPRLRKDPWS